MTLRKKVANKAGKIVRKAQAAPKITDPGPAAGPAPAPGGPGAPKPQGPAGPAGPAGPPKPGKEDITLDVKKDIEEDEKGKAKLDSFGEKLEKLTETLETVVDAMSDQKKILEKVLNVKDTDSEDAFEDFKDDEDELDKDEFSADEFGVDKLITSKEEQMSIKSLRKDRKARLYKGAEKAKESAAAESPSKTISEEFNEDKAKKKTFKPNAPAPQITKVKKSEIPEMLKMAQLALELNEDQDTWTVLKTEEDGNDAPLYEIEKTEESGENFATEDFAKEVFQAMKKSGVMEALAQYDAVQIENPAEEVATEEVAEEVAEEVVEEAVEGTEVEAQLQRVKEVKIPPEERELVRPATPEKEEKPKETINDYRHRFTRAFRVSLAKMQKNLTNNPLKSAFFDTLTKLGMDEGDAAVVIEASFTKGADEHFEEALKSTEELLEMSDEAFVEYEAVVGDLDTKAPETERVPAAEIHTSGNAELKRRASRSSLPLSTASKADPTDREEQLSSVLPKPKLAGISDV